jgi:two-component system, OmpR family, heavy metal sensor histidine kinase CusS
MNGSLSRRLAAMFAGCAAAVFVLGGVLLDSSVRSSLDDQVRDELQLRAQLFDAYAAKVNSAEQWIDKVVPKLDAIAADTGGARLWIEADATSFRYGRPPAQLEGKVVQRQGFAAIPVPGYHCDFITLVHPIAASGDRPAMRLMLAMDPTANTRMIGKFRISLTVLIVAGVALVAVLGYWIARIGLRPLDRLSRQAHGLSPANPAQRLGFAALPAELRDLTGAFNGALQRLEGAYKQLEAFNADVAHELRTPLMNLIGQTQVALSRRRSADDLEDVLQSNLEELERLRAIVNDMLFLARADQGARALDRNVVSLAHEVRMVSEFLEPLIEEAGVRMKIEGDEHVPIETALFRRAVSNLLHNAIRHSSPGGEIVVRIDRHEGSPCVSVSNPGGEIESRHLVHLFDRFYRVDSSRRNSAESHGLGLSIVKAVATMHRGAVFARSTAGWNTFGFTVAATD